MRSMATNSSMRTGPSPSTASTWGPFSQAGSAAGFWAAAKAFFSLRLSPHLAPTAWYSARAALRRSAARLIALVGVGVGFFAAESVQPLAAVPGLTALALFSYRPGEAYGFLAVDGALFAGALIALALS